MAFVDYLYREPTIEECAKSNILVPYSIYNDSIIIPVRCIDDILNNNYKFLYNNFKAKHMMRVNRLGRANEVIYSEHKFQDSALFFVNIDNIKNTVDLLEHLLNWINSDHKYTLYNLIVLRFYVDYKKWKYIYDKIMKLSTALSYKINVYDSEFKESIEHIDVPINVNDEDEIDYDILD